MKTLTEVEQLTGIKAQTLRQRINRKTLKARKIGKTWVLSSKTVDDLVRVASYRITWLDKAAAEFDDIVARTKYRGLTK